MSGFTRASASIVAFVTAAAAAGAQTPASTQIVATIRVVYIEVAPTDVTRAIDPLKSYREATKSAAGIASIEVVQQIGRPNFFAIHESWKDGTSLQTHLTSAANRKLTDDLRAALLSPIDDRLLAAITTQPAHAAVTAASIFVLTHADAGARREDVPGMLTALAAGARRENGSILFDATVQPTRTNHFTIIEVWSDRQAYDAHVAAANTKTFRTAFAPLSGALYDERIYQRLP